MKYIDNSFYFVPRFKGFDYESLPLTVDNTYLTVDSSFITADQIAYLVEKGFIIELTNEFTMEVTYPTFDWEIVGSFVKITFTDTLEGYYSAHIFNETETIYKNRFSSYNNIQ